jgi:hypothetical protein
LADELSGSQHRCPGATDNELVGLVRSWAAIESWAASAKLGVVRELIRRDGVPSPGAGHGDLPESWSQSLRYELSQALACSTQSAETTAWLAWEQQARLPGIGALLDDGTLTFAKARAVTETFRYLTDADAAKAEAMILSQLKGKTYPQVLRLAEQAALTIDPGLAERRREQAQQRDARVSFFREQAGTAALSGRDLPPDEALAAHASVNARAEQYKDSAAFGDTRMDVLRAYAYLDLLNGVAAETRIASAEPQDEAAEAADDLAWAKARAAKAAADAKDREGTPPRQDAMPRHPRERDRGNDAPASDAPADEVDGDSGDQKGDDPAGGSGPQGPGPRPGSGPVPSPSASPAAPCPPRPTDLIVPLATLLGLAERPGEIQGFGLLDPTLARDLAAAATASPSTEVCITVTSPEGYAIAHGCARRQQKPEGPGQRREQRVLPIALARLPARLNIAVPAAALPGLTRHPGPWDLTQRGSPDPLASTAHTTTGCGSWELTLPGGRRFAVRLDPVPLYDCDHRYETRAYQPTDRLRHLVQVRDGTCTFPSCNRHARESDFEHAVPYDKGGRTCACNAGARSRACHHVKQTPGWNVTQPRPGWHQWITPAGRVYTQEPKRYPA